MPRLIVFLTARKEFVAPLLVNRNDQMMKNAGFFNEIMQLCHKFVQIMDKASEREKLVHLKDTLIKSTGFAETVQYMQTVERRIYDQYIRSNYKFRTQTNVEFWKTTQTYRHNFNEKTRSLATYQVRTARNLMLRNQENEQSGANHLVIPVFDKFGKKRSEEEIVQYIQLVFEKGFEENQDIQPQLTRIEVDKGTKFIKFLPKDHYVMDKGDKYRYEKSVVPNLMKAIESNRNLLKSPHLKF